MPEQVEVRSDIPCPPYVRNRGGAVGARRPTIPWRRIEVGQFFLFPADVNLNYASARANGGMKTTGFEFVCRTLRDGPDAGRIGCWRVA